MIHFVPSEIFLQKLLKAKLRQTAERGLRINIKKVPVSRFLFPYFRDSHEMVNE